MWMAGGAGTTEGQQWTETNYWGNYYFFFFPGFDGPGGNYYDYKL